MKLTNAQLKQIIKEELETALNEDNNPTGRVRPFMKCGPGERSTHKGCVSTKGERYGETSAGQTTTQEEYCRRNKWDCINGVPLAQIPRNLQKCAKKLAMLNRPAWKS